MAAKTCALSDICGTHFGETKAVAWPAGRPASASFSMSSILIAVGTFVASLCRPSRARTSTMRTLRGRLMQAAFLLFLRTSGLLRRLEPGGRALFQERAHALPAFLGRAGGGDAGGQVFQELGAERAPRDRADQVLGLGMGSRRPLADLSEDRVDGRAALLRLAQLLDETDSLGLRCPEPHGVRA